MPGSVGTIRGQMSLDVKQALAAYTAARAAHLSTMTALSTGSAALMKASAGIAGVGIAIGAGLVVATKAAADFERKLDYFGAVSNATQAEYEAIRKKAIQLGQDTIYSAGEIADSFVELGKAGVSAGDIVGGIGEGVAALGAAADIPLDTAANIMMSAVQTFGLSADHAVGVADKLAGAANASIIEVEDLGVSLKYAGGIAANLGVSFEETVTALALLGKYGIRGSTAGTSLRQTLVSLSGSTDKARKRLQELGIITEAGKNRFFNADGSAKSLAETFQILQDATKGMSQEAKLAAFKDIFQTRALPTVIALTKSGTKGFNEMADAINKTTAADVAAKRLDNLSGDIEILRGNIETLVIQNGSVLQDFFRGLVQGVTQVVQAFANLSPSTQALIVKILAFSAVGLTVVGALGMFAGAVMNIIGLALKLAPVFKLIGTLLGVLRTGFIATWAAALGPVGLIIAGVAALVAGFIWLWNNVEGFRNFWTAVWNGIKTAAVAVFNWFKTLPANFSTIWNNIKTGVSTVWNAILNFFRGIPQKILQFFLNFTLPGLLIKHWQTIKNTAVTAWNAVISFFRTLPQKLANGFKNLPQKIGYIIGFMIGRAMKLMIDFSVKAGQVTAKIVRAVISWFQKLPGRVASFISSMRAKAIALWNKFRTGAIQITAKIISGVINFFQKLPGRVASFISSMRAKAISLFNAAKAGAVRIASQLVTGVINFIRNLPSRVASFISNMKSRIVTTFNSAKTAAVNIAKGIYNGVKNAITNLPSIVGGIFGRVVSAIRGLISRAFSAVKDFGKGLWEGFKAGLGIHSPSYIERAMWQITGVVDEETQHMKKTVKQVQSLGNGINEVGNNIGANFGNKMAGQLQNMKTQLKAARSYQGQLGGLSRSASLSTQMVVQYQVNTDTRKIEALLQEVVDRPQIVQEIGEINNPKPEPAGVSAARQLRKVVYAGGIAS